MRPVSMPPLGASSRDLFHPVHRNGARESSKVEPPNLGCELRTIPFTDPLSLRRMCIVWKIPSNCHVWLCTEVALGAGPIRKPHNSNNNNEPYSFSRLVQEAASLLAQATCTTGLRRRLLMCCNRGIHEGIEMHPHQYF